jgi:hypothetical protein
MVAASTIWPVACEFELPARTGNLDEPLSISGFIMAFEAVIRSRVGSAVVDSG